MKPVLARFRGGIPKASLWQELFLASRFVIIGVVAALIHMAVVWTLIESKSITPVLANFIAFLTAFFAAFIGHYFWTFRVPGNPLHAMRRYFFISGSAFVANTLLLVGLLKSGWLSPVAAAVAAAAVIPLITFLASRLWGFRSTI